MAMSPAAMAEAIFSEMEKEYWPLNPMPPFAEAETKKYYTVLSTAIINYVKANCDVNPGTFSIPSAGNVTGKGSLA
jgi:hypothetical protein